MPTLSQSNKHNAKYRIVPFTGSFLLRKFYRVEERRWWGWKTIRYACGSVAEARLFISCKESEETDMEIIYV